MRNVHRLESRVAELPVSAYVIEGERELVAVDGTLTVSGGRAVRARVDEMGAFLTYERPRRPADVG
jgi:hypothetical protein